MDARLQPHARHADRLLDTVLIVDHELLRQHVDDLPVHRQRDRARGVDHALDVGGGDLAVLDRHDAVAVEAADVRAGDPGEDRVDLAAGHQLGFADRLADRFDRGVDIDDHALAQTLRRGGADAHDLDSGLADFGDDRRDFVGADVESDDQARAFGH